MSDRLTLLRPDDWHIHLRDGAVLAHTVADAARTFGRAIIMPNLVPRCAMPKKPTPIASASSLPVRPAAASSR